MAVINPNTGLLNKSTPLIELRHVSKIFKLESGSDIKVLDEVNLSVGDQEVVALLGPSGSGKSTCLRIMCGLINASSGDTLSRGKKLEHTNLDVALIFQSFALFPWETIFKNIALALKPLGLDQAELEARVKRVIDLVGLEGFEEAYPRELSGGMKQRVGIARALVMDRPILFLDEPFSALDVLTADTLRTEMVSLFLEQKTSTKSMVLVTHNITEAVFMAKRILVMGTHPGRIRREFNNDLPFPRDVDSPQFKDMVSQIHAVITETLMPDVPKPSSSGFDSAASRSNAPIEPLPNAQIIEMIGLIEAIADRGGKADIFELSHKTGIDFGKTLYLVKAAELLEFADTPKQLVVLTVLGKRFADGDINQRKKMLNEALSKLKLSQVTAALLKEQPGYRISISELSDKVSEWLPNENPEQIIKTLVSWGRFAEFLGYNDDTKEIYLDQGEEVS